MKTGVITIAEGSAISNLTLPSGYGFPSNPNIGEMYLNRDTGDTYYYNGTAWVLLSKYPQGRFRNKIFNGNFDFWRYATSATAANTEGLPRCIAADRWSINSQDYAAVFSRQAFTPGQTEVPNNPKYFGRVTINSASTTSASRVHLSQTMPNYSMFSNKRVTVSFWAKANATKQIAVEFSRANAALSSEYALAVKKFTIGTAWQKITFTFTVPKVNNLESGIVDAGGYIRIAIWMSSGADHSSRTDSLPLQTGTFDISQVQFEAGEIATPFEQRSIATELTLCKRFLYVTPDVDTVVGFAAYRNSVNVRGFIPFDVELRTTPTLTFNQSETLNKWSMAVGSVIFSGAGTITDSHVSSQAANVFLPMATTAGQSGHLAIYGGTHGYKMFASAEYDL